MSTQSGLQSRQQRKTLFAQGRQIATNTAKSFCPARLRKQPDTFCCTLSMRDPAQPDCCQNPPADLPGSRRPLSGVCATGRAGCCSTLFDAPLGPRRGRRSGSDLIAFIQQAEKRKFPIQHFQRIEPVLPLCSRLLGRLLHREEQVFELGRPDGSLLLCLKHQLAEKMHQAQRMLTVIQEVRCPGIMNADAFEDGQDANRVQSACPRL